jgi:hypothetical protein
MADSWRLKVQRAEYHFEDLKRDLHPCVNEARYKLVAADARPKCHEHGGICWDYMLRMETQPDSSLAVIAGDILFNLRSALDHIAVALVPSQRRSKASFPIESEPIWERKYRRFVVRDAERRRRFRDATKGMPEPAVALIKRLQPYHGIADGVDQDVLYQLSRLNNADKHRQLVVFLGGLLHVIYEVNVGGHFARAATSGFKADNTRVFHFIPTAGPIQRSDVKVQISGTPVVGIKVVDPHRQPKAPEGFMEIGALLEKLLTHVPEILDALEPYVRARRAPRAHGATP